MHQPGRRRFPRHFSAGYLDALPCRQDPNPSRWQNTARKRSWKPAPARARGGQEKRECDQTNAACEFLLYAYCEVGVESWSRSLAGGSKIRPADRRNARRYARGGCQQDVISLYNSCLLLAAVE